MHYHYTFVFITILIGGGFFAGIIDTLAGGGGLISLPILAMTGLPPAMLLGTNKLQGCIGEFTAMMKYIQHRRLDFSQIKFGLIITAISGSIGAITVQFLHPDLLYKIIPFIMLGVLIYLFFLPRITQFNLQTPLTPKIFYIICGSSIGFYNGFFGPGTGTFWICAFLGLQCFTMQNASIYGKPLNFIGNFASLFWFMLGGKILYIPALIMAVGQIIGAQIGVRLVMLKGSKLIRPIFLIVVSIMTIEMFYRAFFK